MGGGGDTSLWAMKAPLFTTAVLYHLYLLAWNLLEVNVITITLEVCMQAVLALHHSYGKNSQAEGLNYDLGPSLLPSMANFFLMFLLETWHCNKAKKWKEWCSESLGCTALVDHIPSEQADNRFILGVLKKKNTLLIIFLLLISPYYLSSLFLFSFLSLFFLAN